MKKTVDVIVTYNRLELLKENINSLLNQNYKNHDIMIINNASTDDTEKYVLGLKNKRIIYYNTGNNLGGAGGFAYGIEKAIKLEYDYAWIMDDDSIPEKDALMNLIEISNKLEDNFSFLASLVYWTDNKIEDYEETLKDILGKISNYSPSSKVSSGEIKLTIQDGSKEAVVSQFNNVELTTKGTMMFNKLKTTFDNFGESVSYEERINIITRLYKEIISPDGDK